MKRMKLSGFKKKVLVPFLVILLLFASGWFYAKSERQGVISKFGKYQGYSEELYDGTQRTSDYLILSDGTHLAYDLIIPTQKGILANQPLPVLLSYTPYGRTWTIFDESGVINKAFYAVYALVPLLDRVATPVDSDPEGVLLDQARESREKTASIQAASEIAPQYPFRDSMTLQGANYYQLMDLSLFIDRINHCNTAIYMTVGWFDLFTADMFYWYNNLSVPRRLTVRPTDHSQVSAKRKDLDYGVEALRWLDYWLKGIDNDILDEPSIHYYIQDGPKKGTWQTTDQWPLATHILTPYYFGSGKGGTIDSVNDGALATTHPESASTPDDYMVDYSTTTGTKSRWGAVETAHKYPDLREHDAKALTYTTQPLESSVVVTGHPVIHLWLSSDAPDLDVFVYLEEVDRNGRSTYITEGILRASHRKLSQAPFDNFGLP